MTRVGELFVLGFRGTSLPEAIRAFEAEHGLGGVILFDRDVASGQAGRNVTSPAQLRALCAEVHALPSRPLVMLDQEGGRVRRLKTELGFAPLPAAAEFAALPPEAQRRLARASFAEMTGLGVDLDLAPVVDLDTNPDNPNIGALGRSYGADPARVERIVALLAGAAREAGLLLCLKHYPGLGGATTDSHEALTDLSGRVGESQLDLFHGLVREIPGEAILLSHGSVDDWDPGVPVSVSPVAVDQIRRHAPDALLLTDDLEMQGLQAKYPTVEACVAAVRAGVDLLLLGNNLARQDDAEARAVAEAAAAALAGAVASDPRLADRVAAARARIAGRKAAVAPGRSGSVGDLA